jgi:hypothetical protein
MVQRQQARWSKGKFSSSKVTVSQLKEALLDPENGFTTNKPVETSLPPPKTSNRELVPKAPSRIHSETPGEYFLHDHRLISLSKLTQGQDPPTPLPSPDAEVSTFLLYYCSAKGSNISLDSHRPNLHRGFSNQPNQQDSCEAFTPGFGSQ